MQLLSDANNNSVQGSTFNDVHGNQINITHVVTVVSNGQEVGKTTQVEHIPLPSDTDPSDNSTTSTTTELKVKVSAMLDEAVARRSQKLEWRTSIVDLLKVCNMDSSYSARKKMALDLCWDGDMNDSYSMNVWLHKKMMAQLMGKVEGGSSKIAWCV
ncbi:hypothetical protein VKT23_011552 [Stygiomarasmius scandens]|uniref:DUF3597 domain-containing protein n=1 Tax=Marasmiellus scandens TaxID=2682957 RepID=A0ABR1J8K0_9AGAR